MILKNHSIAREIVLWRANTRTPAVTRALCELSDDHLKNIWFWVHEEYPEVYETSIKERIGNECAYRFLTGTTVPDYE